MGASVCRLQGKNFAVSWDVTEASRGEVCVRTATHRCGTSSMAILASPLAPILEQTVCADTVMHDAPTWASFKDEIANRLRSPFRLAARQGAPNGLPISIDCVRQQRNAFDLSRLLTALLDEWGFTSLAFFATATDRRSERRSHYVVPCGQAQCFSAVIGTSNEDHAAFQALAETSLKPRLGSDPSAQGRISAILQKSGMASSIVIPVRDLSTEQIGTLVVGCNSEGRDAALWQKRGDLMLLASEMFDWLRAGMQADFVRRNSLIEIEHACLEHLVRGCSSEMICQMLNLGRPQFYHLTEAIVDKTNAGTRPNAVALAKLALYA